MSQIQIRLAAAMHARVGSRLETLLSEQLESGGLIEVTPFEGPQPLQVVVDGCHYTPSSSTWIRATAATLGRFPRADEIEHGVTGALVGDDANLGAGLAQVCLEVLRNFAAPAFARGSDDPTLTLGLNPSDYVELHDATPLEIVAGELARLVWEATGVPLSVQLDIDPAYRAGQVGVTLGGVAECPIPLLPRGFALSRHKATPERVIPIAGNALWQGPAEAFTQDEHAIDRSWSLTLSLYDLCRERVGRFASPQTLEAIYRIAEDHCPQGFAVALERLGKPTLDQVIACLIRNETPLHDLRTVFQSICELEMPSTRQTHPTFVFGNTTWTREEPEVERLLVQFIRIRLASRIMALVARGEELAAHVVSRDWVDRWRVADGRERLALESRLHGSLRTLGAVGFGGASWRIPIIIDADLRTTVADLTRCEFPRVYVLSFDEVPPWMPLRVLSVNVGDPPASADG